MNRPAQRRCSDKTIHTIKSLLVIFYAFMIFTGSQARPVHLLQNRGLLLLRGEGEVNPVKAKNPTKADPGMSYPNLNILTEIKTSKYDDETWSITETAYSPSMFYTRVPLANG
jgi:hypothetical protein